MVSHARLVLAVAMATGFLASPAFAAGVPKEGTCKFKVDVVGKEIATMIDDKENGVASWDEDWKIGENCKGWPPMTRHCFGLLEIKTGKELGYGLCVAKDGDGDSVVWKQTPHPTGGAAKIPAEVLMTSGKYAGMKGTSTSQCVFSGDSEHYEGTCDEEMTYKIP
jgi:hypothetical protein